MIYNSSKIQKLLNTVEENLTEDQQEIVKEIVSNYNKLFMIAKEKSDELKRKQEQYSKESTENEKLRDKNKELERDRNMLKMQNREQRELLKMYKQRRNYG